MKQMKRILCILLAAMTLMGVAGVAASAAPVQGANAMDILFQNLLNALLNIDLENLTKQQLDGLVSLFNNYKNIPGFSSFVRRLDLPISVKAALHRAGIVKFPIYERSLLWNFIFKYFLFGWIWM